MKHVDEQTCLFIVWKFSLCEENKNLDVSNVGKNTAVLSSSVSVFKFFSVFSC